MTLADLLKAFKAQDPTPLDDNGVEVFMEMLKTAVNHREWNITLEEFLSSKHFTSWK